MAGWAGDENRQICTSPYPAAVKKEVQRD